MPKRIALFFLGVVLAIGAFLLYQHFTGSSVGGSPKGKLSVVAPPTTLPMTVEQRNEQGVLEYVITAPGSPEQIKDASGKPIPGQFRLKDPIATFFDRSGRTVEVRGKICQLV